MADKIRQAIERAARDDGTFNSMDFRRAGYDLFAWEMCNDVVAALLESRLDVEHPSDNRNTWRMLPLTSTNEQPADAPPAAIDPNALRDAMDESDGQLQPSSPPVSLLSRDELIVAIRAEVFAIRSEKYGMGYQGEVPAWRVVDALLNVADRLAAAAGQADGVTWQEPDDTEAAQSPAEGDDSSRDDDSSQADNRPTLEEWETFGRQMLARCVRIPLTAGWEISPNAAREGWWWLKRAATPSRGQHSATALSLPHAMAELCRIAGHAAD